MCGKGLNADIHNHCSNHEPESLSFGHRLSEGFRWAYHCRAMKNTIYHTAHPLLYISSNNIKARESKDAIYVCEFCEQI